jgi:hypothetical protein
MDAELINKRILLFGTMHKLFGVLNGLGIVVEGNEPE